MKEGPFSHFRSLVPAAAFGLAGCGDTTGPGEGKPDDPIEGNWIGIYDQSFEGTGGKDADMLYFEFTDDGEFTLLSFLESDPAGGHMGTLQDFDHPDGDSCLLVSITYCDYSVGGYCDYYTVNRYELNASGDQLTLWHGDDAIVLELQPGMDGK